MAYSLDIHQLNTPFCARIPYLIQNQDPTTKASDWIHNVGLKLKCHSATCS